jgi:hypothetical protein
MTRISAGVPSAPAPHGSNDIATVTARDVRFIAKLPPGRVLTYFACWDGLVSVPREIDQNGEDLGAPRDTIDTPTHIVEAHSSGTLHKG